MRFKHHLLMFLQDKGFVAAVLEHWLGSREDKAASLDDTGEPAIRRRLYVSVSCQGTT